MCLWKILTNETLQNEILGHSSGCIRTRLSWTRLNEFRGCFRTCRPTPTNGLACSLLEIDSASQLKSHFARGSLFENLVINEFMKNSLNQGKEPRLSFWRDNVGHEVDMIQDRNGKPYAYEIKSAETFNWEFLGNLNFWGKISGYSHEQKSVLYAGTKEMSLTEANVIPWEKLAF